MVYSDKHRKINVPTDNVPIQATLRQLEQPICLFGERPAERRRRLQNLISSLSDNEIAKILLALYHDEPDELQTARYWIAEYALSRAKERIEKLKEYVAIPEVYRTANIQGLYRELREWFMQTLNNTRFWHPQSTLAQDPAMINLASSSFDGSVKLWNLQSDEPIAEIEKRIKESFIIFIKDLETQEEILPQEGHSKAVHGITFHCDGSLSATAGMDTYGRIWDLRTGRCIIYHIATGSEDNLCKIWDLRPIKNVYNIAAHESLVSTVKFQRTEGHYLVTVSYDNTIKSWTHPIWSALYSSKGHE
ncbi:unnamed protein product [Rotaria socialis]|uniref:Pre-mRNA processing factor 4 (PRP4)-like domain-containing protein n=1 Tax=Rotaria socialis TaxID=392032 RepID=A0A818NMF8_9BILA|nr:unnamed protein product [Rotaria socialis]